MTRSGFDYRILVVDDEEAILATSRAVLESQKYEVKTARNGFEALVELRRATPDILITDLSMPGMSGFELLSIVRKRFPQVAAIVISGAYGAAQGGLIADAFLAKGQFEPAELFQQINRLLAAGPPRSSANNGGRAPVWIPLGSDSYFVVTCPECLRSFSVANERPENELRHGKCVHCSVDVTFLAGVGDKITTRKKRA